MCVKVHILKLKKCPLLVVSAYHFTWILLNNYVLLNNKTEKKSFAFGFLCFGSFPDEQNDLNSQSYFGSFMLPWA